jgi:impB/mucB/samB family C-terminal domain
MINGLAKEVEKRMTNVGVYGSQITLKLKQRHPDAAAPPKFLGHGKCYNHSKSQSVPGSKMTRDSKVIGSVVMGLFIELQIPSEDIRGMGIMVSKLSMDSNHNKPSIQLCGQQSIENWYSTSKVTITETDTVAGPHDSSSWDTISERENNHYVSIGMDITSDSNNDQKMASCNDEVDNEVADVVVIEVDNSPIVSRTISTNCSNLVVDDIVLPALSQIHMSQVNALPMEMQSEIKERIQRARALAMENFVREQSSTSHELSDRLNQLNCQQRDNKKKYKTKLHAIDVGGTESTCPINTKKRQHVSVTYTATSDPNKFFSLDIQPLNDFMQNNSPTNEHDDAIKTVIQFLSVCIDENRLSDVIVMLRNIRKWKDASWNTLAYERIYHSLNIQLESKHGFTLDPEYTD